MWFRIGNRRDESGYGDGFVEWHRLHVHRYGDKLGGNGSGLGSVRSGDSGGNGAGSACHWDRNGGFCGQRAGHGDICSAGFRWWGGDYRLYGDVSSGRGHGFECGNDCAFAHRDGSHERDRLHLYRQSDEQRGHGGRIGSLKLCGDCFTYDGGSRVWTGRRIHYGDW